MPTTPEVRRKAEAFAAAIIAAEVVAAFWAEIAKKHGVETATSAVGEAIAGAFLVAAARAEEERVLRGWLLGYLRDCRGLPAEESPVVEDPD